MAEFLDFKEISQRIPFADVLDYLNIAYTSKGKELKGEGFIVDTVKNLYFNPKGDDKGSVINFLHANKGGTLRECAIELKKQFLDETKKPQRDIPTLELEHGHPAVSKLSIDEETAEYFDIGYCGRKSIMSGKVAFKIIAKVHSNLRPYQIVAETFFAKIWLKKMVKYRKKWAYSSKILPALTALKNNLKPGKY